MKEKTIETLVKIIFLSAALSVSTVLVASAQQKDRQTAGDQPTTQSTSLTKDSAQNSSSSQRSKKSSPQRNAQSKKDPNSSAQSAPSSSAASRSSADTTSASGQAELQSATQVMAELVHGKLSPSSSKPGDTVTLKLMQDVKSDGEVVLKKGSTIQGVVSSVSSANANSDGSGSAQSMINISWMAPAIQGHADHSLGIVLQGVQQVSPFFGQNQQRSAGDDRSSMAAANSQMATMGQASTSGARSRAPGSSASGGGLVGATVGAVAQTTGTVTGAAQATGALGSTVSSTVNSTVGGVGSTTSGTLNHSTNATAGLFQPEPADAQTTAMLQHQLGLTSNSGLFQVGHGQIITAGGDQHNLNIFSQMNNDAIVTSPSKKFELTSGAQMQLLVGLRKQ